MGTFKIGKASIASLAFRQLELMDNDFQYAKYCLSSTLPPLLEFFTDLPSEEIAEVNTKLIKRTDGGWNIIVRALTEVNRDCTNSALKTLPDHAIVQFRDGGFEITFKFPGPKMFRSRVWEGLVAPDTRKPVRKLNINKEE